MGCTRAAAGGLIGILCLTVGATGCAGNGSGLDANGNPLTPGSGSTTPLSADFDSIQENIFTPICSVCHVGGGAPEGLRLDAANSYNLLVGIPSTEVPSILRVKPGDPVNSYIIQKLQGHAAVGAQMPFGGPYLSTATIAFIQQWITNGAPPSSTTSAASLAPGAKLAVVTRAPSTGEVLDQSPPQIMIGFNRSLELTGVDTNSARIERLPVDETSVSQQVPARVAVPSANPTALTLWPLKALPPGQYRVVLPMNDAADTVITSFEVRISP
jgi:hypothetical protein